MWALLELQYTPESYHLNGIGSITSQCLRKDPVHTFTPDSRTREISGEQAWKQQLNERVSFIITSSSAP